MQTWRWQQNKRSKSYAAPSLGRPDVVKDDRRTVYVRNMPFRATEDDIIAFFSQAGKVEDVRRGADTDGMLCSHLMKMRLTNADWHTCLQRTGMLLPIWSARQCKR